MISNKFKLFLLVCIFLYQTSVNSKTKEAEDFNPKYLSNYLSAIISYGNQNNEESVKYFNSSKVLVDEYKGYLKDYVFALVLNGEVQKAINQVKSKKNQNNSNFFEANLLLLIDNFKKKKFKQNVSLLSDLKRYQNQNNYHFIIYETLNSYNNLFLNKVSSNQKNNFGKLSRINEALQFCYLNSEESKSKFINLINSDDGDYSRYLFFYLNYIINKNDFDSAKQISTTIKDIGSSLLIAQTKIWIQSSKFDKIKEVFSCQNETDLLSEFFFLISNFLALEKNYEKSNFFAQISIYLNPKFYFNSVLLLENYFENEKFDIVKSLLKKFEKKDEIYYWFRLKKTYEIISLEKNSKESLKYIEGKFNIYKNPPINILLDMANIYKRNKQFKKSIKMYTSVLKELDQSTEIYAEILYRRGGSYERIGDYLNSDKDLIQSLSIRPNDPYVMNYLAYGWLERNLKINEAIAMLEKAYKQKTNDPFIIDSVGWGYYLINDFVNAEKFLRKAIQLMPKDPIVNDHYGDVLWKLNRKLQARYYWESALKFVEVDDELKNKIFSKLLKGL